MAFCLRAVSRSMVATSGSCAAEIRYPSGLIIPAFSVAISARVSPSISVWSRPTGATTETIPSATFVESHEPPIPTSRITTSTGSSAKIAKASTVMDSKNVSFGSPRAANSSSTRVRYGKISSQTRTNVASGTGSPLMLMRSVTLSRWGLVKRPVRRS